MSGLRDRIQMAAVLRDDDRGGRPTPNTSVLGLKCRPNFLTPDEELALVQYADAQQHWMSFGKLKRRLPFGFVYNVSSRTIVRAAPPIPPIIDALASRLVETQMMSIVANQIVVQDYPAGVGIGAHVDAPVFGPEVCSISLLSSCVMRFRHTLGTEPCFNVPLDPRSALALTAKVRTDWSHEIAGRSVLGRRLSITFRTVIGAR